MIKIAYTTKHEKPKKKAVTKELILPILMSAGVGAALNTVPTGVYNYLAKKDPFHPAATPHIKIIDPATGSVIGRTKGFIPGARSALKPAAKGALIGGSVGSIPAAFALIKAIKKRNKKKLKEEGL